MAVLQMKRISICALKKNRKAILEMLQVMGIMEVSDIIEEDDIFNRTETANTRAIYERNATLADNALEVLNTYAPEKTSMLSSLAGKDLVELEYYRKLVETQNANMRTVNQILGLNKKIAETKAAMQKLESQIESLVPWMGLDIPLGFKGTRKTVFMPVTISGQVTLEDIWLRLAETSPALEAVDIQIVFTGRDLTYLTVLCMADQACMAEEALRACGFARPPETDDCIPGEKAVELEARVQKHKKELQEIVEKLKSLSEQRTVIKATGDYYRARAQKYGVLGGLPQSKNTFIISGYVPEKVIKPLVDKLEKQYELAIDIADIPEEEEMPILLENNPVSESVEGVLASFGLPQRHDFDPTAIMSFFYFFFFGMMLADAAYGLIVTIACYIAVKKFPRMETGLRNTIKMFMYCGISTAIWGILFGGYFGDTVNIVSKLFFGKEIVIPALWFAPLDDPIKLLMVSLLFGLIHLFTGHFIKGYILIRDKKYMDFICDFGLWTLLLVGLLGMLLPSEIFASMSQMHIEFPPILNTLFKWMAIIGAAGICLMSARSSKNPVLRVALGAYDLYNITGWLSDVLSYSRLLALGLATGVIAQVINQMGSMFGSGIVGVIGFTLVFLFGHAFNLAINLLGAYVHTNRLQYVEFFGKFYEGGGRAFNPFQAKTKYVDIKEET